MHVLPGEDVCVKQCIVEIPERIARFPVLRVPVLEGSAYLMVPVATTALQAF